jgi:pheromone shutdown protein TraB
MIVLLGVGHVFDLERSIRDEIRRRAPKVVALELDSLRYEALLQQGGRPSRLSIFGLFAQFQSRIAQEYGVHVGDEMLAAARAAQEIGSEVALIDRDSRVTLQRAWREMPFEERIRLLVSALASLFVRPKRVEAELDRFYLDEDAYLREFADEMPTIKRVLIDERDAQMADSLRRLHDAKGEVVAVVGDGHVEGIGRLLDGVPIEMVRLRELREPAAGPTDTARATIGYRS